MASNTPAYAVSASGSRTGDPLPKGAVCTSVEIQPSENGGFTVSHRYRAKATGGSGQDQYRFIDPRDYTFESRKAMLAHLAEVFP